MNQKILPASASLKQFEIFLESPFETGIILDTHLSQIKHITQMAKRASKKLFFHVDLINGLKSDEYGTQYLCQEFKPFGIISTKSSVIQQAKKYKVVSVQRMFMIDSHAIERSFKSIEKAEPDYIEVLPGSLPHMINEVAKRTNLPIFAGGLIRSSAEVEAAIEAGAISITTSKVELWNYYSNKIFK